MHNIGKLVRENRDEAFSKLKELGGTIDFNMEQVVEEEDLDDVPYWVVVTENEQLTDVAVLNIYIDKSENGERILFFGAHRDDCGEFHVFPYSPSECSGTFENEIYIAIDEAYKKEHAYNKIHVLYVVDENDNTKNFVLATQKYNTESLRKLLENNVPLCFGETAEEISESNRKEIIADLCEGKQVEYKDYTAFYEDIILV